MARTTTLEEVSVSEHGEVPVVIVSFGDAPDVKGLC